MKFRLTSGFMELSPVRDFRPHTGIDFAMPEGTKLRAIQDGVVERIYDGGSIGQGVAIKLENGNRAIYGHMNDVDVKVGDHVHAGDLIGLSGNTGNSTGPHLHFGMRSPDGTYLDPTPIAEKVAGISGENPLLQMQGPVTRLISEGTSELREQAKQQATDIILGTLDALRDILVELSFSIALLGGGISILLYVAGWRDGLRWTGILSVASVIIKCLLGGYLT